MSYETSVRVATPADAPDIKRVAGSTWHTVYDDILGSETVEAMVEEGYAVDRLEEMAALDDIGLFVPTVDGEVVGHASCGLTDPHGIGDFDVYVHPDYWGEGIGSDLLDRGFDHLRGLSVRRVRDQVLADNEPGNAFYAKHFERVDERTEEYGGEPLAVNVYERTL